MKYSLDFCLIFNDTPTNRTRINTVLSRIPAKLDNKVWADQYDIAGPVPTMYGGNIQVSGMVRFHAIPDRDLVFDDLRGRATILNAALTGSYIRKHICGHDSGQPCTIETVWSK